MITWSSSSTTTSVSLLFLKSRRVILGLRQSHRKAGQNIMSIKHEKKKEKKSELGPNETYQKKRPILVCPSNTRTPVGVRPRLYSLPSRACRAEVMKRQEGRRKKTHQRAHIMILSYANVAMHIPFSSCLSSRALPVWDPTCAWCVCKRYRKTVSLTFTICMSTPYISSHFALFR